MLAARPVDPAFSSTTAVLATAKDFGFQAEFAEAPLPSAELDRARSVKAAGEVARALKMRGLEALLFVSDAQGHPRPVISALLDRLDIRGMNT